MPRIFRILPDNGVMHILTRGNNHLRVFKDSDDYKVYLDLVRMYKQENKLLIYHYCLMPNHVHLILELNPESNLAKCMKQINLAYLYYYKKRYKYDGHLWQGRYKSLIISKDEYLISCGRYIELNPVKAGIVSSPAKYRWSSYKIYAHGRSDGVTDYNPIYSQWGNTEEERQNNYKANVKQEIKLTNKHFDFRFIGSDKFIKKMEQKFKVSNNKPRKGRPKK